MNEAITGSIREQLLDRRTRLQRTITEVGEAKGLMSLLRQVDSALEQLNTDVYGNCIACGEPFSAEELVTNPLVKYCLCSLSPEQERALERDLGLAWRVQAALLPRQNLSFGGWTTHYRYEPAGPVSGDYCDIIPRQGGGRAAGAMGNGGNTLYAMLGDISGKGIAASFLMARLHALMRGLVETGPPARELVERANRLFSEGTIASHYATLVGCRAGEGGEVEICNAGHVPPVVLKDGRVSVVEATGLPVGLFGETPYTVRELTLSPGDTLFLYSDGLSETRNAGGDEFGTDRLARTLEKNHHLTPGPLAAACLAEVASFAGAGGERDDLTILVVRRGADRPDVI